MSFGETAPSFRRLNTGKPKLKPPPKDRNKTAGFETVHGLLDRMMQILEVPRISASDTKATHGYYLKEKSGASFFVL